MSGGKTLENLVNMEIKALMLIYRSFKPPRIRSIFLLNPVRTRKGRKAEERGSTCECSFFFDNSPRSRFCRFRRTATKSDVDARGPSLLEVWKQNVKELFKSNVIISRWNKKIMKLINSKEKNSIFNWKLTSKYKLLLGWLLALLFLQFPSQFLPFFSSSLLSKV